MKKAVSTLVLAALLAVSLTACSSGDNQNSSSQAGQATPQADMQINEQSAYPFLLFQNKGTGPAENVQVVETKSGTVMAPLAHLKPQNGSMQMNPPEQPLTLQAGEGEQVQLTSKDLREYTVKWTEQGHAFSKQLVLRAPKQIETH